MLCLLISVNDAGYAGASSILHVLQSFSVSLLFLFTCTDMIKLHVMPALQYYCGSTR
jgi:hypothetical protein